MQLPQIRMNSEMAQISINQVAGKQTIRQPEATISIQQPEAKLTIRTTPSKLNIDQSQAWADMNLMSILKRNDQFANEGRQAVLAGIGRRASQGTQLMKIENKGNPLIEQAAANAYEGMKSLGIKFIPSQFAVKINYQPSQVNIDVKTNEPIINVKQQNPVINYDRGNVEVGMKQHQSLEINFTNLYSATI